MHKKELLLFIVALFVLPVLLFLTPVLGETKEKAPGISEEVIGWQLTNARVVNAGITTKTSKGILVSGYEVVDTANAIGDAPLLKGEFHMTASIFSPYEDMPGQKAGNWYLSGSWTITDLKTSKQEEKWHSADMIRGNFLAELSFNPAADAGQVDAFVSLPMSLATNRWTAGEGIFSGNEKFEGIISLAVDIWPDVMSAEGGQP